MNLKRTVALLAATASLLAAWSTASAAPYVLVAWHQRSNSGALSSLMFKAGAAQGCPGPTYIQPCYNPAGPSPGGTWTAAEGVATDIIAAGPASWDWNGTTMTMTGLLWAASSIGSNPNGTIVISDRVTNLTITPNTTTSTAATYECREGTFLSGVGANGCLNLDLDGDINTIGGTLDSTVDYNVGASANCVDRTVLGDDLSTGNPRAVMTAVAGGGCDAIDGGFNLWTIVPNARFLILSNTATITNDGCYMFGRNGTGTACALDVSLAGASYMIFAPNVDTDGDGVVNALDNCSTLANATQVDSDADGFGNRCDGDFGNPVPGNGTTNSQDYILFRAQLSQPSVPPTYNRADINANGVVNSQDYILFRALLTLVPGPSGLCSYPCPVNP